MADQRTRKRDGGKFVEMRWCCNAGGPPPKPRDSRVGAGVGVCQNDKHAVVLRSTVPSVRVRERENKFSVDRWAALGRSSSLSLAIPFARLSRPSGGIRGVETSQRGRRRSRVPRTRQTKAQVGLSRPRACVRGRRCYRMDDLLKPSSRLPWVGVGMRVSQHGPAAADSVGQLCGDEVP